MSGLEVRGAVVRYGAVTAVAGVDLEVAPGEIVALLGASGSGKSSLLRAVTGLEPLISGTVSWDGVDLAGIPVHKRGIALMFQEGQLFPHLSVAGNVAYGLFRMGRAERERRVGELLELVGLAGYGPRPVTSLSGGQAQRVALARSLAPAPRMLLLDEPLAALDRGLREHLVEVLSEGLRRTRTAALYVTHDQDEAFTVADRVGVLAEGRLLQLESPGGLWAHPVNREVAAFLGYGPFLSPMTATAMGWSQALRSDSILAVGPLGLVPDSDGVAVPIVHQRYHRGFVDIEVTLPDGQAAVVRATGKAEPPVLSVRLDHPGCVVLPA